METTFQPNRRVIDVLLALTGLTHDAAAAKVGVSRRAFEKWCDGTNFPKPEHQEKLRDVFGRSAEVLLKPADLNGDDVVILFSPKKSVECPHCLKEVRVL